MGNLFGLGVAVSDEDRKRKKWWKKFWKRQYKRVEDKWLSLDAFAQPI